MRIFVVRQLRQVTVGPRRQTHTTDLRLHLGTRQLCMFYHSHDDCDGECCCCYNYTHAHTHTHTQRQSTEGHNCYSVRYVYLYICLHCTVSSFQKVSLYLPGLFLHIAIRRLGRATMLEQRRCSLRCGLGAIDGRQQIDDDRK